MFTHIHIKGWRWKMQGGMNPYLHNVRTANTGKEATITVQGEGIVKAKPNVVILTIGIRTDSKM